MGAAEKREIFEVERTQVELDQWPGDRARGGIPTARAEELEEGWPRRPTDEVDHDLDTQKFGDKTLREVFADAGCLIGPAGCAACLGGPEDTFGRANEPINVVSTTNRNFPGRMGHKGAGVYLASPLTAAASALTGRVTDPRDRMSFDTPIGRARKAE